MLFRSLRRQRWNARAVEKKSILSGIDKIKRHQVFITETSKNILREFGSYKWKTDKDGKLLDVPFDAENHTIDSIRYVLESTLDKRQGQYKVLI